MGTFAMYIPSFINTGSGILKLMVVQDFNYFLFEFNAGFLSKLFLTVHLKIVMFLQNFIGLSRHSLAKFSPCCLYFPQLKVSFLWVPPRHHAKCETLLTLSTLTCLLSCEGIPTIKLQALDDLSCTCLIICRRPLVVSICHQLGQDVFSVTLGPYCTVQKVTVSFFQSDDSCNIESKNDLFL
jgi:hypothetical protein